MFKIWWHLCKGILKISQVIRQHIFSIFGARTPDVAHPNAVVGALYRLLWPITTVSVTHLVIHHTHLSRKGTFLEGKRENYQLCSVQYCAPQLCTVQCTHIWTDLTVLWIGFCLTGPNSLCLDSFLYMYHWMHVYQLHGEVGLVGLKPDP